jgi:hypothetical protein
MCCDGLHDVQAKLDIPGQIRFVTVCAVCGREQRELMRRPYMPAPRVFAGATTLVDRTAPRGLEAP